MENTKIIREFIDLIITVEQKNNGDLSGAIRTQAAIESLKEVPGLYELYLKEALDE